MKDCKRISTPIETGKYLEENERTSVNTKDYQGLIGSLTYLAMGTRPDISAALGMASQFASNPSEAHWKVVKRILRYLKGTIDYSFSFNGNIDKDVNLCGYVNADWAGDITSRKSQSRYIFQLCRGQISWVRKKQGVVALSTTEAFAAQGLLWLRKLLEELGYPQKFATLLFEDNIGAINF